MPWYFGLGFYWAWLFLVFYSSTLALDVDSVATLVKDIWLWAACAHAFSLLLGAVFSNKIKVLLHRRFCVFLSAAATCIGTAMIPFAGLPMITGLMPSLLTIFGSIVIGASTAIVALMWGEAYSCLATRTSLLGIVGSYLLGILLFFVVMLLPGPARFVSVITLPALCCLTLWIVRRTTKAPKQEPVVEGLQGSSVRIILPLTVVFLYALCGEILRGFATYSGEPHTLDQMGMFYLFGGGLGVLLFFILQTAVPKIHKAELAELTGIRTTLLIMAAGFFVSSFLNVSFHIAYAVFGGAFFCFRSLIWMYSSYIARRTGVSPLRVFGITQGSCALAVVLGTPITDSLASIISLGVTQWSNIALLLVFLMFATAVLVLNQKDISTVWGLLVDGGTPGTAVSDNSRGAELPHAGTLGFLKDDYGLSAREFEVATLLARGRSLPFIQKKLHIAQGTAQTHLNHIYKKLNVHSRQEFLDLLESRAQDQTG